ncbi:MAG: permease prefix domain 1-containing protein [Gemmatimonadota bacterium]
MSPPLDAFLDQLRRELRRRGVIDPRLLEEVRGHVLDAVEARESQAATSDEALTSAIRRFGTASSLAAEFAAERNRTMQRILLAVSVTLGLFIGYVDSRSTWDDTGITAGVILLSSGILGALGPERPWLWALCLSIWIPVFGLLHGLNVGSLIAVAIAFAGAYAGKLVRHVVVPT